jgi:hypothetical protein
MTSSWKAAVETFVRKGWSVVDGAMDPIVPTVPLVRNPVR